MTLAEYTTHFESRFNQSLNIITNPNYRADKTELKSDIVLRNCYQSAFHIFPDDAFFEDELINIQKNIQTSIVSTILKTFKNRAIHHLKKDGISLESSPLIKLSSEHKIIVKFI